MKKATWNVTLSHFLVGCRFDVLIKLLAENKFRIPIQRLLQVIVLLIISLILFPFAIIEEWICSVMVYPRKVKAPVFILGHWRSGTTYLQNLLAQDPQFAYFDPVTTYTNNNALLLHGMIGAVESGIVSKARPMDNVEYESDSPSEECFSVANRSTMNVVNILVFPENCREYLRKVVISRCRKEEIKDWENAYTKVVSKTAFINHGKRLLLKSPDNTCHITELLKLYPEAKFVHIYRNPYKVIASTIHMVESVCGFLSLQKMPEMDIIEDMVIKLYETVYREFLIEKQQLDTSNLIEIKYEELIKEPKKYLKKIYQQLGIHGYSRAKQQFDAYIEEQKDYQTNHLKLSPKLREKINERLDFAFVAFEYIKDTE